jgi:anti-anti-sigma factor
MDAVVVWDKDVLVVTLSGTMDFDKAFEFRKKSLRHFIQNKVVFSLKNLNFVGSTGMSSFVETIAEISQKNPNGIGLCEVGLEYKRLLEPYFNEKLQLYPNLDEAKLLNPIQIVQPSQDQPE